MAKEEMGREETPSGVPRRTGKRNDYPLPRGGYCDTCRWGGKIELLKLDNATYYCFYLDRHVSEKDYCSWWEDKNGNRN